ncbi:hypothetical protein [Dysgonomonas macrotermitis]|uniref:Uncharacterized protein n=1 Tax=Dysgonomonas macrotermitis TaxID=1346286 RepID=A0A1M5HBQ7_9BACT|nr:hypothetical protein [Dysgonomonas macrotermitis]SHG13318.1 hypothetical protein SAMN05444362_11612 [Dysgonomonas macrotermitis]
MKTFEWKEEYLNWENINVAASAVYASLLGASAGTGTRQNPYTSWPTMGKAELIIGNGSFNITSNLGSNHLIIGQSMESSIINQFTFVRAINYASYTPILKHVCVKRLNPNSIGTIPIKAQNSIFDNLEITGGSVFGSGSIVNCVFKGKAFVRYSTTIFTSNSTFIECTDFNEILRTTQPLLVRCSITIDNTTLSSFATNYAAFSNCSFIIGDETEATVLSGNTPEELKQSFIDRCETQGLTIPQIDSLVSSVPEKLSRWIFTNDSTDNSHYVLENSYLHQFYKKTGIIFGFSPKFVKNIPITTESTKPESFVTGSYNSKVTLKQDHISLSESLSSTSRIEAYADSKIIWLEGKKKLNSVLLNHNLPATSGIDVDSTYSIAKEITASGQIKPGSYYIVRSADGNLAQISYNGKTYNTSILTRTNIFCGVEGVTEYTASNETKPSIYEVGDFANHKTLQIRIVDDVPTTKITSGNVLDGYWYYVVPNNLDDTSGRVTYKGVAHPCFDSFLTSDTSTISVSGNCHLRRCWKQNFDFSTETTDKTFWTGKQKPIYFDINPEDMRCFHAEHTATANEMLSDDETYIASGHPDFYSNISGSNGVILPTYDITGCFMQIRVPITTLNPM